MDITVVRDDCEHICHSDEQLERFLEAGWTKAEPKAEPKEEKPKKAKAKD